jgi:hypothetical protein
MAIEPVYVVATARDEKDLAEVCNLLYERGYFVQSVIPIAWGRSEPFYTIVAYRRLPR